MWCFISYLKGYSRYSVKWFYGQISYLIGYSRDSVKWFYGQISYLIDHSRDSVKWFYGQISLAETKTTLTRLGWTGWPYRNIPFSNGNGCFSFPLSLTRLSMSNKCRCHMRIRNCLSLAISWVYPRFSMRSALLIFLVFCVVCFALFVLVLYIVPSVASTYGSFIPDCQFVLPNVYLRGKQASKQ